MTCGVVEKLCQRGVEIEAKDSYSVNNVIQGFSGNHLKSLYNIW